MRIVYNFPYGMPVNWPSDYRQRTRIVEDGNEETLHIEYQDQQFERPMFPWTAEQVRAQVRVEELSRSIV